MVPGNLQAAQLLPKTQLNFNIATNLVKTYFTVLKAGHINRCANFKNYISMVCFTQLFKQLLFRGCRGFEAGILGFLYNSVKC